MHLINLKIKLTIVIFSEGPESSSKHTRMSDHKEDEMDESILDNDDEELPTFASKQTTSHLGPEAGLEQDVCNDHVHYGVGFYDSSDISDND